MDMLMQRAFPLLLRRSARAVAIAGLVLASAASADWVSQGPTTTTNGGDEGITSREGNNPITGAINSFVPSASDANVLFVAGVNGGVWKTVNAKTDSPSWLPITDDALPSLSISAVALSPVDPNLVFAGSGRLSSLGNNGGSLFGVARSTDGGVNWTITGANVSGNVLRIVPLATSDAGAGPVVLVLAATGIYRSADAGATFTALSDPTLGTTVLTDLARDPGIPARVYAGGAGRIFKSENAGAAWAEVSTGTGFTVTAGARILLAVHSRAGNDVVYAAVINAGALTNVYRSVNQGGTWTALNVPTPPLFPGKQGEIHGALVADPADPTSVWISGDRQTDQTEDGSNGTSQFPNVLGANNYSANIFRNVGGTWENVAVNGANGTSPHADSRSMVFDADGALLHSCDGGIFRLNNPNGTSPADMSGTRRWVSVNGDLRILESHNAAYDPVARVFTCGAQDNGVNTQRTPGNLLWAQDFSGDGGRVEVDSDQTAHPGFSIRYDSTQNFGNFKRRTFDANNVASDNVTVGLMIMSGLGSGMTLKTFDKVLFLQPFVLNRIDPKRMLIGTEYLYESMDRGDTLTNLGLVGIVPPTPARRAKPVRPTLARSVTVDNGLIAAPASVGPLGDEAEDPGSGAVVGDDVNSGGSAMAYGGKLNGASFPDVLYAGSDNQVFHRVKLGDPLTKLTAYPGDRVRELAMDPANYKRLYVLDNTGKIFATTDEGVTWADVTRNLPTFSTDIRTIELATPDALVQDSILYAGGLGGVWKMPNPSATGTWTSESAGLPKRVLIYDLRYEPSANLLSAAALGRGIYSLTAPSARLINIATRLRVETGDNVGIAGLVIQGGPKRVLIRAIGPDLANRGVAGALADPLLEIVGNGVQLARNDNWKDTQETEIRASGFPPVDDRESAVLLTLQPGVYTAIVRGVGETSGVALLEVYDLDPAGSAGKLVNLSTRGRVQTGDNVVIGGFVIGGSGSKRLIVRALGPSLANSGVAGVLANPSMQLISGPSQIGQNDDWASDQQNAIMATGFAPTNPLESAIVATLTPGAYTVIVRGVADGIGVGSVEIYDLP